MDKWKDSDKILDGNKVCVDKIKEFGNVLENLNKEVDLISKLSRVILEEISKYSKIILESIKDEYEDLGMYGESSRIDISFIDNILCDLYGEINDIRENCPNIEGKKREADLLELQIEFFEMGLNREIPIEWGKYLDKDYKKYLELKKKYGEV
jgi:hypothetical protein